MASRRLASSNTLSGGTKMNSASRSTNFLMSHGQATRSTLTCSRVIHFMRSSIFALHANAAIGRSVFGPMRNRPLSRVLDGSVRRQCGAKLSHGWMCLHPLPPSAEGRVFRIHALSFLRQSERVRARQDVEVGQSRIGSQQIILPVAQLAFQHLKAHFDFWKCVRDNLLVGCN